MTTKYDAVVIGGGHNGLVAAAYLARAGRSVVVLERRPILGGASVTEEVFPGFKYSVFSYLVSLLRPEVIHELELAKHGLMLLPMQGTFNPLPNGNHLYREADPHRTRRNIARHSVRDGEAYSAYKLMMHHMAKVMHKLQNIAAPNLMSATGVEELRELGRDLLALPEEQLQTLVEMLTMSAADFLDTWFESDVLKAALASSSIIGSFVSPRSPGSAYVLLHHYMGEVDGVYRDWAFAKGGTGAVAEAIAAAARAAGVQIETSAPVAQVTVKRGRVAGVVLENGDELGAKVVVSSLTPQLSFLKLVDPQLLPPDLVERVQRWNSHGSSGKVNLALDALPEFDCLPGRGPHLAGGISITPSLDYLERAYDDAKYGDFSRRPFIDMLIPSVIDPDMAPPGKHVMSCFVQYAPYELRSGTWEEKRQDFGDAVINVLSEYIGNLRDIILHRQVLTPWDIEQVVGISGGNIFHGELLLSQLFVNRPAAGWSDFRTPIDNYYVCGSSVHPGGGISGAPGRLAALRILGDRAT